MSHYQSNGVKLAIFFENGGKMDVLLYKHFLGTQFECVTLFFTPFQVKLFLYSLLL